MNVWRLSEIVGPSEIKCLSVEVDARDRLGSSILTILAPHPVLAWDVREGMSLDALWVPVKPPATLLVPWHVGRISIEVRDARGGRRTLNYVREEAPR